jgi:hypothetical protein
MAADSQIALYKNNFIYVANSTFIPNCYSPGFNKTMDVNAASAIANITNLNDFAGVYDQYAKLHIGSCGDLQDYYVTYELYNDYCNGDCGDKQRDGIITVFNDYLNEGNLYQVLCDSAI